MDSTKLYLKCAYNLLSAKSLMSKIVKECPADPIEFLIGKLQAIQRQKRKVSHIHDYKQVSLCMGG